MIVLDANILLYAYDSGSTLHLRARSWVEQVFSEGEPLGLPWQTVAAFLRVVTNPKLRGDRFTVEAAAAIVDQWLEQPNVRLLAPGDRHWSILRAAMVDGQARGPLVSDAHLAALTMEHGGVLHTTDRDFARFPGLRWMNPLQTTARR
ncbi:MAG: PIN domain-containing protein [Bryobacteraceae bacterium]|nr:PIN domain-containing protein [Bryobacteraceae bacterium]